MKYASLVFSLIFCLSVASFAQYNDFGFKKSFDINVINSPGDTLPLAWTGGLNSCQFHEIDLNFDNIKDLVVFDRTGNKLLTFINNGTPNSIDYSYKPEYEAFFPYMHDWLFLVDYNNDGKEDIFSYSTGGMSVFRNDSDPVTGLMFTKVVYVLNSLQFSNYLNLYVSEVEIPAIADVNGDGCPDILVFHILGSYLNLHTNMSFIKYGHCDSLDFQRTHHCWGNFYESENSPDLTLNIVCPIAKEDDLNKDILHVGSTLLVTDLDSNGLKDLILSDTDFPGFKAAYNGGTLQEAHITRSDNDFPLYDTQLELFTMPMPSLVDVNNDGKKDLLASPYDANPYLTESKESVWLYLNTGTDSAVFNLHTKNFLQSDMCDVGTGAYPILYDIDNDGLADLFIANYGYRDTSYFENGFLYSIFVSDITYYKNTGTPQEAEFTLVTDNFANIRNLELKAAYPAFGDIDGDGDVDMLIGEDDGTLRFFENTAGAGNPPVFAAPVNNFQGIDVGRFSAPTLIDLDNDGLTDIVSGDRRGRLNFYKNTGTLTSPIFTLITDTLGGVKVQDPMQSNYGYSVPCFFRDSINNLKLFVASESGRIHYYDNIEGNLNGTFSLKDSNLLYIYDGVRTGVAVGRLNGDNYPDMILGNFRGGLNLYMGESPGLVGIAPMPDVLGAITIFPNPAKDVINVGMPEYLNHDTFTYDLYTITGINVISGTLSPVIPLNHIQNGFYLLRITHKTNGESSLRKIVVFR